MAGGQGSTWRCCAGSRGVILQKTVSLSSAEQFLTRKLVPCLGQADKICVVAISGMPGAGKTTLACKLKAYFGDTALHLSEDDFLAVPTVQRKAYLQAALEQGDEARLRRLVAPEDPKLNPYADPLSWYDWPALRACLATLKRGQSYERFGAWDQETGRCDRHVVYGPLSLYPAFVFIDSNYPLEYEACWDRLVYLALDPFHAEARQKKRDGHRSDAAYLAYKNLVDSYYTRPYQDRVRAKAHDTLSSL